MALHLPPLAGDVSAQMVTQLDVYTEEKFEDEDIPSGGLMYRKV